MLLYNPFRSLTILGVLGVVCTMLLQAFDPGALSGTAATVLQGCGILVSALGLRNAHAKGVAAIADLVTQLAAKK